MTGLVRAQHDRVAIGPTVSVVVADEGSRLADEIVPGFDGCRIDPRFLVHVVTVQEHDGMDVARQAVYPAAQGPGCEARLDELVRDPFALDAVGQVHETNFLLRALEEPADR